jgi:DNA-binding transcriptional ArsR family regulator
MNEDATRLRRLVADELGECCDADVEDRMTELQAIRDRTPGTAAEDAAALKPLGDETRYRLLRVLVAAEGALCVCELTPLFEVSESAVSHALSDLTAAGLLTRHKEGRWRYYDASERGERIATAVDETRRVTA